MNNHATIFSMTEKRAVLRILKFLIKAPALCDSGTTSNKLLLTSCVSGTIACETGCYRN